MKWLIYSLVLPLFGAGSVAHAACADESLYHTLARVTLTLLDQGKLETEQVSSMMASEQPTGPFGVHAPKVDQLSAVQLYRAHLGRGITLEAWSQIRGQLHEGLTARGVQAVVAADAREATAEVLSIHPIADKITEAVYRRFTLNNKTYLAVTDSRPDSTGVFLFTRLTVRAEDGSTVPWVRDFDPTIQRFSFRTLEDGSPAAAIYSSAKGWRGRFGMRYHMRDQIDLSTGKTSRKKIGLWQGTRLADAENWAESPTGLHLESRPDLVELLAPFDMSFAKIETSTDRILVADFKRDVVNQAIIRVFEPKLGRDAIATYKGAAGDRNEFYFVEHRGQPLLLVTSTNGMNGTLTVYDPSVDGQAIQTLAIPHYDQRFVEQSPDGQIYVKFVSRGRFFGYTLFDRSRP